MLKNISRRDFLKTSAALAASLSVGIRDSASAIVGNTAQQKRWFKGNLHMHSQWSDGHPLPEWAVDWYKSHGYNFIWPVRSQHLPVG